MDRGKHCTDYQRDIIKRMAAADINRKTIQFVMERSRTFVAYALRTTETCLDNRNALGQPKRASQPDVLRRSRRKKTVKLLLYQKHTDREGGGPAYYIKNLTQNTEKLLTKLSETTYL